MHYYYTYLTSTSTLGKVLVVSRVPNSFMNMNVLEFEPRIANNCPVNLVVPILC